MKILGLGVDLVHIPSIVGVFRRRGIRFPQRVLHETELDEFLFTQRTTGEDKALQFLASRFAAKEATYKALQPFYTTWKDNVVTKEGAKPVLMMTPKMEQAFKELHISASHISLSHDGDYAFATVIFETRRK